MSRSRPDLRAYALLGIVMLLWAGNSIVGRAVRFDIPPFFLAFVRWSGALILILPFAIGSLKRDRAALFAGWKIVLAAGLAGVVAFNALLYTGLHHTSATNALLLQAAIPAGVLLVDFLVFRTRASVGQIAGVLCSTCGVAAIVFRGDPQAVMGLAFGGGDVLILCAVVAWSFYTVLLRLKPAVAPESFLAATFAIGVLGMAPLAATEASQIATMQWTPKVLGAFAYVAVLPSLIGYWLYNEAVTRIGAGRAGQTITLMPLFGALLSALLLNETLQGFHVVGMALILLGIGITAFAMRRGTGMQ